MGDDGNWQETLLYHLEGSFQQLLDITAACIDDRLVDPAVVQFELLSMRDKIGEAGDKQDQAQLEACLEECRHLLNYYAALRKQKAGAVESSFSHLLIQRLKKTPAL